MYSAISLPSKFPYPALIRKNVPNIFGPLKGVYGQYLANDALYTQVKKTSCWYASVDRVHTLNRKHVLENSVIL